MFRMRLKTAAILLVCLALVLTGCMANNQDNKAAEKITKTANLFFTDVGHGRNVVLLHGWTADSNDWIWQLPVLEQRYRTLNVDLRGHGRSEVVPAGGYAPSDYVRDLEALLESKSGGGKFVIIGHSMGGQLAARLALKRPDLVEAVISVDGSLGFAAELEPVFRKAADALQGDEPGAAASAVFEQFYDPATSPALRRWHARRAVGLPEQVVRESFAPLFLGADQVGMGEASERFLRQLRVPVYHMSRDPAQAERMRTWFTDPRSKVDVWPNAGHWIMQDRPDDVNAALTTWIDAL
ncbi:alpha/beta hydrolase [Paenibacillus sp. YSY-4.3]